VLEPPVAPRRGRWSPLALALLAIAACGGRTGGASRGASCNDNGPVHANGTSWTCSDGCNTCSCENGEIASTLVACLRPEGGADADAGLHATTSAEAETSEDATAMAPVDASEHSVVEASGDAELEATGDAELPPSCAPGGPGMTNCGPGGSGTESCCTSLEVAGGTYYRSYTNNDTGPTGEADPATVSTFRLDRYDVTVGRFRQFVNVVLLPDGGAGWLPSPSSGKHAYLNGGKGLANSGNPGTYEQGWVSTDDSNIAPTDTDLACDANYATWTPSPGSQENLPINCVNWWEAYAFCIWDGGFLPSDAEWEYAAAGGSQQREYPWGSTAPGTACPGTGCQYAIYNCDYPSGTGTCAGMANIAPVGTATLGAGLWGQFDLAGDVFEWNLDWYASYAMCTDCANVTAASYRVNRGGSFINSASNLLPPHRDGDTSTIRDYVVGFRCSRTP
jgi:sulfatase modifying factor 1